MCGFSEGVNIGISIHSESQKVINEFLEAPLSLLHNTNFKNKKHEKIYYYQHFKHGCISRIWSTESRHKWQFWYHKQHSPRFHR